MAEAGSPCGDMVGENKFGNRSKRNFYVLLFLLFVVVKLILTFAILLVALPPAPAFGGLLLLLPSLERELFSFSSGRGIAKQGIFNIIGKEQPSIPGHNFML